MFTLKCPQCHSGLDTVKFLSTSAKVRSKEKLVCHSCNSEIVVKECRYRTICAGCFAAVYLSIIIFVEAYRIPILILGIFLCFGIAIPLINKFALNVKERSI